MSEVDKKKARQSAVKPKADYSTMTREQLKAIIKKKLQDGTSEGPEWDRVLEALDKKGGKNLAIKEVATESIAEKKPQIEKNYAEVDKNLKEVKERREARKNSAATSEPTAKERATTAREKATAKPAPKIETKPTTPKPEAPKPAVKPRRVVKPTPVPAIEQLDDLANVTRAPAGVNPQIALLDDLGLMPEGVNPLTGEPPPQPPAAAAPAKPVKAARVAKPTVPSAPGRLARAGSAVKGAAGAAGARLAALGRGVGGLMAPVGAGMAAREVFHAAAPETYGRVQDINAGYAQQEDDFKAQLHAALQARAQQPAGAGMGAIMDRLKGVASATNPTNVLRNMAGRIQTPTMQDFSNIGQGVRNLGDKAAGLMGGGGYGMAEGMHNMSSRASGAMSNMAGGVGDAVARLFGGGFEAPQSPLKQGTPPPIPQANFDATPAANRIEAIKQDAVKPQQVATAAQKIQQAKSRPAKAVLKSSPARAKAASMFGGLPQNLQDSLAKADQQAMAMMKPQISAPDPSQAPVDFGKSFADAFSNGALTQDRLQWLNGRPSGLDVQEQVNTKPNPFLRALASLRRPY